MVPVLGSRSRQRSIWGNPPTRNRMGEYHLNHLIYLAVFHKDPWIHRNWQRRQIMPSLFACTSAAASHQQPGFVRTAWWTETGGVIFLDSPVWLFNPDTQVHAGLLLRMLDLFVPPRRIHSKCTSIPMNQQSSWSSVMAWGPDSYFFHFVPWNQLAVSNFFINCAKVIKLKLFLVYSMVQVELLFLSQFSVRSNLCI
jgi:hypothetical protein